MTFGTGRGPFTDISTIHSLCEGKKTIFDHQVHEIAACPRSNETSPTVQYKKHRDQTLLPHSLHVTNNHDEHNVVGHFTFWISLSLKLSPNPKFGLRPKISRKVKSFFSFGLSAETKLQTERSLNPKLINSPVDFACTRLIGYRLSFYEQKSLFRLFTNKQRHMEISVTTSATLWGEQ